MTTSERERLSRRSRDIFLSVADIGEIPPVVDATRKKRCHMNLRLFLETYFPQTTGLRPFSKRHVEAIQRLQLAILEGGRFLNCFPRGYGKSTIGENAALWAILYGHRRFVPLISANEPSAKHSADSIKSELEQNALLHEDFPEVCHAVRALEGKVQRCKSQTYGGDSTYIEWTANKIALPWIKGSAGAGAAIVTAGLGTGMRGMRHKRPDGVQQRPDFAIIDDPQTDESAGSPAQVDKRIRTIRRSVLRLGGHDEPLACVVNATMIEEGDLVDQLAKDASWNSIRVKMVEEFATHHEDFWLGEYATKRQTFDPSDPLDQARAHREANELYQEKREHADAGCVVSWEHCYQSNEISAIQHAYNILIDDGDDVFFSECQNEPRRRDGDEDALTAEQIAAKINRVNRGQLPEDASHVTAFVDVQKYVLYYTVAAWTDDFTGWILDYGTFPQQRRPYFTANTLNPTLVTAFPSAGVEGAIRSGLDALTRDICGREWKANNGSILRTALCLIDAGYKTDLVHEFVRRSPHASILKPSKGYAVRASHKFRIEEYQRKPGDRVGPNWRLTLVQGTRNVRHVLFDTNAWKSFIHARLGVSIGDDGCLSLFGDSPRLHRLYADHLTAEYKTRLTNELTGRTVEEWTIRPEKPDNHWLDCTVGCAVAASLQGVRLPGQQEAKSSRRYAKERRRSLAEMRAAKR